MPPITAQKKIDQVQGAIREPFPSLLCRSLASVRVSRAHAMRPPAREVRCSEAKNGYLQGFIDSLQPTGGRDGLRYARAITSTAMLSSTGER